MLVQEFSKFYRIKKLTTVITTGVNGFGKALGVSHSIKINARKPLDNQ